MTLYEINTQFAEAIELYENGVDEVVDTETWVNLLTTDDFLAIFSEFAKIAGFHLVNNIVIREWTDSAMCKDVVTSDSILISVVVQTDYNDLAVQYIKLRDFSAYPLWATDSLEVYNGIYYEYMAKKFGENWKKACKANKHMV